MISSLSPADRAKFAASRAALSLVEPDMKLGLGTGSTANWFVRLLGERMRMEKFRLTAVATSTRTADLARAQGIEVVSLDSAGWLDLTIDGADEVDPALTLIKGGGGAHLQEKIVASASDRMVVITDSSKLVDTLGAFPLPLEVIPFGWRSTRAIVEEMLEQIDVDGRAVSPRMDGDELYRTDEGNHILDLHLGRIGDAHRLSPILNQVPGVVENGLFLGICDQVMVGYTSGEAHLLEEGGIMRPVAFTDGIDGDAFVGRILAEA
ncbi:ribose-5-phosphate isomerase RpiA [Roseobacter sp. HKCCA0434]|uniref:ribose-5-phosphate isomerase RpiA n=1 Tax=Roseobacter sp. HKCCA0434 TaxID=3079297 RepID=UPI002905D2CE|nr:ribose-5-phosphate isomerase RpiA [Roseobacter sp. HKCCA0434]